MPNAANAVNIQNTIASHFILRPLSSAYIGPPIIVPSCDFTLYLIASRPSLYLVAIPRKPAIQHHNTAPGPPRDTAVATPMMFPVPIVAAREVASAPNWLTSPLASGSFLNDILIAVKIFLCGNLRTMVRNRWVPNRSTIVGHPHSAAEICSTKPLREKCNGTNGIIFKF